MTIFEMTIKDFKALPVVETNDINNIDSIILMPTNEVQGENGFSLITYIICRSNVALGRTSGKSDMLDIITEGKLNTHTRIDCLPKSKLIRIFVTGKNGLEFNGDYENATLLVKE